MAGVGAVVIDEDEAIIRAKTPRRIWGGMVKFLVGADPIVVEVRLDAIIPAVEGEGL